jgi:hypothetical protein
VAVRYGIVTAGENWVTVVTSGFAALPGLLKSPELKSSGAILDIAVETEVLLDTS